MSPMSDQPVTLAVLTTALAQFHREIVLPDMHRVFEDLFERRMKPRFDEIDGHFDVIYHKLDKLETEYEFLKVGLARVEGRLDRIEGRLDRIEGRIHVLESQYQDLLAGLHRLEERLGRVERNVDELVAAKEKEPLRAEVADLRARVDSLQAQVRNLESRLDQ